MQARQARYKKAYVLRRFFVKSNETDQALKKVEKMDSKYIKYYGFFLGFMKIMIQKKES